MKNLLLIILILILSCSKEEYPELKQELNLTFVLPNHIKPCGDPKSVVIIINEVEHHSKLNIITGGWKMEPIIVDSGTNLITKITLSDTNGSSIYTAVGYFDLERFDVISNSNPLKVLSYPKIGAGLAVVCY